ncbi:hypothetical protein EVAR_51938_1 [Eumeta japonica]|uniref:Uncharacterized protein n=1 Tax=Eumeta variegata TaxID=151549 RepID=A0A4C1YL39_EUMVA|nr:hypothetical protein EVAR_51938_1 [Eumeta japonica]
MSVRAQGKEVPQTPSTSDSGLFRHRANWSGRGDRPSAEQLPRPDSDSTSLEPRATHERGTTSQRPTATIGRDSIVPILDTADERRTNYKTRRVVEIIATRVWEPTI